MTQTPLTQQSLAQFSSFLDSAFTSVLAAAGGQQTGEQYDSVSQHAVAHPDSPTIVVLTGVTT